jgi:hypothetical protein
MIRSRNQIRLYLRSQMVNKKENPNEMKNTGTLKDNI